MSPGELLLDAEAARCAAQSILDTPGADDVEVLVSASATGVTRFANSQIIQNIARKEVRAHVRVAVGDRIASSGTNQLDAEHMKGAVARALEAARATRVDADFPGFARPDKDGRAEAVQRWDDATAAASPACRAEAVNQILGACDSGNAAGIYETSSFAFGVFSSAGIDCFDAYTRCAMTCLVDNGESTGWGDGSSHAMSEVDIEAAARRAARKAEASKSPRPAVPGTYEVVLEPAATGTIVEYLSYAGFGAKQVLEDESFLARHTGEEVGAPSISILDDVWHPQSVGIGFDFEGVPRKRVAVIEKGRAKGPVSDLRTARQMGVEPTGHASGSNELGPYAANVVLEAGDRSLEELIGGVSRGFLVTRFHYVNILDRPATLLTGMTRDGTFAVEGGAITGAVHNFRFAQNVLSALASVQGVGRDLVSLAPEYGGFGSTVAPALHLGEFEFVSTTSH
ncbi:MAG: TldD/PmbA family protein [Actinomycetota bacterium]|nr:TldD/PmbA family protein [Actinomycetota bacterium]